ncbi:MAG: hypothetical protein KJ755_05755 [Alphaproteobacteria bacterium]|nr:hypothetical protein [Alphaproteobacteria bacterium]
MDVMEVQKKVHVATGREVADMLGVSQRRLQQMISEELISGRIGRDQYDLTRVIVTFREYLRQK